MKAALAAASAAALAATLVANYTIGKYNRQSIAQQPGTQ